MLELAGIAALLALSPLLAWYWVGKVRTAASEKRLAEQRVRDRGGQRTREDLEEAGLMLFRTTFLALVSFFVIAAGLYWLVPSSGASELDIEVSNVNETVQRIILAAIAFTVLYALAVGILPQIFPEIGTRKSRVVTETTALLIAAFFAISVGTSNELFDRFSGMLVSGAAKVFAAFIGILFAAIGVFLAWRRITTMVRPSGPRRSGLFGRADAEK